MTTYAHEWKTELSLNKGDEVLFTDFCPNPEDLWGLYENGIKFAVLDHHITAVNNLDKYWEKEPQKANIVRSMCKFDMNKCGATLTWDFFNQLPGAIPRPQILEFIEIADLWKWEKNPDSVYINQYVRSVTKIGSWHDMAVLLDGFDYAKALEAGKLLRSRLMDDVENIVDNSSVCTMFGMNVRVVNSGHGASISEVGNELARLSPDGVGLVYNILGNRIKISTRGLPGTTRARELAEKFGGGGHNEASGAYVKMDEFLSVYKAGLQYKEKKNAQ
jgi:oligoribonuclease NrnB/cAMP/cGMP phosphodiesterase (DHH superfamily)